MTTTQAATFPTTALSLFAALKPLNPVVEGDKLGFGSDPPTALKPILRVLHTGIRALVTKRRWFATTASPARSNARFSNLSAVELDPDAPIPANTIILCVEGDKRGDRVRPVALIDHPELFAKA
jgi:hypothetical protein